MKCKEIFRKIEEKYPLERAENWDNPGLLAVSYTHLYQPSGIEALAVLSGNPK